MPCRVDVELSRQTRRTDLELDSGFSCTIRNGAVVSPPTPAATGQPEEDERVLAAENAIKAVELACRAEVYHRSRRMEYDDPPWNGKSRYGPLLAVAPPRQGQGYKSYYFFSPSF